MSHNPAVSSLALSSRDSVGHRVTELRDLEQSMTPGYQGEELRGSTSPSLLNQDPAAPVRADTVHLKCKAD